MQFWIKLGLAVCSGLYVKDYFRNTLIGWLAFFVIMAILPERPQERKQAPP